MKNFEIANMNKPEEIIQATQRALIQSMQNVIQDLKKDLNQPGLTWEQIEYFLDGYSKKIPQVITQEKPF